MSEQEGRPFRECPESVTGHSAGGSTDGSCTWCGRRNVGTVQPVSRAQSFEPTELREAYDYYHDPDFGALDNDQIRTRYQTGRES